MKIKETDVAVIGAGSAGLSAAYPDLKNKIFGAMQRLPLPQWEPKSHQRRPLPDLDSE